MNMLVSCAMDVDSEVHVICVGFGGSSLIAVISYGPRCIVDADMAWDRSGFGPGTSAIATSVAVAAAGHMASRKMEPDRVMFSTVAMAAGSSSVVGALGLVGGAHCPVPDNPFSPEVTCE